MQSKITYLSKCTPLLPNCHIFIQRKCSTCQMQPTQEMVWICFSIITKWEKNDQKLPIFTKHQRISSSLHESSSFCTKRVGFYMWCENKPTPLVVLMSQYCRLRSAKQSHSPQCRSAGPESGCGASCWTHPDSTRRPEPRCPRGSNSRIRTGSQTARGRRGRELRKNKKVHKTNFSNRNVLQAFTFRPA